MLYFLIPAQIKPGLNHDVTPPFEDGNPDATTHEGPTTATMQREKMENRRHGGEGVGSRPLATTSVATRHSRRRGFRAGGPGSRRGRLLRLVLGQKHECGK